MAKKAVLEVEEFNKVLNFVSEQKISTPGAVEAYAGLLSAVYMDIEVKESEEVPPEESPLTEEQVINSFTPSAE